MENEQNIDDIVKLLIESVNNPAQEESVIEPHTDSNMSNDTLQEKLKEQYSANGAATDTINDNAYDLDRDMLKEFAEEQYAQSDDREDVEDIEDVESDNTEKNIYIERGSNDDFEEEKEETDRLEKDVEEAYLEDLEEADTQGYQADGQDSDNSADSSPLDVYQEGCSENAEILTEENESAVFAPTALLEVEEEGDAEDVEEYDYDELFFDGKDDGYDVIESQTEVDIDEDIVEVVEEKIEEVVDEVVEEEIATEKTEAEFSEYDYPEYKPISFKTLMMMDYGRSDPVISKSDETEDESVELEEEDTPDVGEILSDFEDRLPSHEEVVNDTMRNLMVQMGCEDEMDGISTQALNEVFSECKCKDDESRKEGISAEKVEHIREEYKKKTLISSLWLTACGIMALILFLYDFLPLLDVEFFWIADYTSFPRAYVMIGTQLLLLCAVCIWRQLFDGIKKLTMLYPNIHSMIALMIFFNIAYDLVFLITDTYIPHGTPMFHFISGIIIFLACLSDFLMNCREAKSFDIYSSDVAKFTLSYDNGKNSIADKMYSGGFSKEKKIYAPSPVSYPKGFFDAIKNDGGFDNKILSGIPFVGAVVCVIYPLVLLILKRSLEDSMIAAITCFYALMPVLAIASTVPLIVSGMRLASRGISLTNIKKIKKYSSAKTLIFNDFHLFRMCQAKDVGFVCYEKAQTNQVLAALQILYSRIGGPMSEVFSNIPEQCRAKRIRVRRIARTGIEAVIDRAHILIIGDREFLRRYGIEFPNTESTSKNGKNATIYVSYEGRASAKISARYTVDPLFDMLVERFAAEGGHCVIETYDPMINTAFVAKLRKEGRAPVSVVHKNAQNINNPCACQSKKTDDGILVLSSKFKLIEAIVWCSRICKIEKLINIITYVSIGLAVAVCGFLSALGAVPYTAQYLFLAYLMVLVAGTVALTVLLLPKRNYFSVAEFEREQEEKRK